MEKYLRLCDCEQEWELSRCLELFVASRRVAESESFQKRRIYIGIHIMRPAPNARFISARANSKRADVVESIGTWLHFPIRFPNQFSLLTPLFREQVNLGSYFSIIFCCTLMVLNRHLYHHVLEHVNDGIARSHVVARNSCDPAVGKVNEHRKLLFTTQRSIHHYNL